MLIVILIILGAYIIYGAIMSSEQNRLIKEYEYELARMSRRRKKEKANKKAQIEQEKIFEIKKAEVEKEKHIELFNEMHKKALEALKPKEKKKVHRKTATASYTTGKASYGFEPAEIIIKPREE